MNSPTPLQRTSSTTRLAETILGLLITDGVLRVTTYVPDDAEEGTAGQLLDTDGASLELNVYELTFCRLLEHMAREASS